MLDFRTLRGLGDAPSSSGTPANLAVKLFEESPRLGMSKHYTAMPWKFIYTVKRLNIERLLWMQLAGTWCSDTRKDSEPGTAAASILTQSTNECTSNEAEDIERR